VSSSVGTSHSATAVASSHVTDSDSADRRYQPQRPDSDADVEGDLDASQEHYSEAAEQAADEQQDTDGEDEGAYTHIGSSILKGQL
jgi:hypothetical protein